ncbi:cell wall-active antibiotics response protein LiaF [Paenibacillus sp. B01]|uniref:cell wall-active antibiotics response protein LiaF n=1 Tax=Paenibacillus sp. B01 TaxID=2660554 RepID=UPI001E2C1CAD|nr:cell wall-active antibiotics response protein LiaF [Paenibacillus sp. B01]
MNHAKLNQVLTGLAIVGIGALFLFHTAGLFGFEPLGIGEFISRYWPIAPLYVGVSMLLGGGWLPGIAVTLFALVMLSRNTGIYDLEFSDAMRYLIPVGIIAYGLQLLLGRSGKSHRKELKEDEWTSYNSYPDDVPEPPPLHPDPLGKDLDREGRPEAGSAPPPPYGDEGGRRGDGGAGQGGGGGGGGGIFGGGGGGGSQGKDDWREELRRAKRELKQDLKEMKDDIRDGAKHHRHAHRAHRRDRHDGGGGRTEWWNTDANVQTRSNFIGDIHLGHDYWDLVPLNISHFIGDTVIDLTRANIAPGETRITVSSFIGDVKVFLPTDCDIGIQVVSSAFIGDSKVLGRKEGGMFRHMDTQSSGYRDNERRIKLVCSTFIGDVRVTKVG